MTMDHLPVEVITNIMRFLGPYDRREVALINRRWYYASLDPILHHSTVVTCTFPSRAGTTDEIFSSLVRRRTPNLVLEQLDEFFLSNIQGGQSREYLANHLLSLSLKSCDITESVFVSLISQCYSLRKLDLSSCSNLFMSGILLSKPDELAAVCHALQNLTELNLSSIRHLTDQTFNRIVAVAPRLNTLHLAGDPIVFYMDSFVRRRPRQETSSAILTFTNLHMILKERAVKMKVLNLSRTAINDDAFVEIAKIPELELQEIHLINCAEVGTEGIINFCKIQQSLTVLDLSQCREVTDSTLAALCHSLRHLKVLKLAKCSRLTDDSIAMLYKLAELRTLDVSSCYFLTSEGLSRGLCKTEVSNLTHLILKCCSKVNDIFFLEACSQLQRLRHLDLASTNITNKGLMLISKHMTGLVSLDLSWCKSIDDDGLLGNLEADMQKVYHDHGETPQCNCTREHKESNIFNKPHKYREKTKQQMSLEMRVSEALGGAPVALSNLKHLERLSLASCHRLTDASLEVVAALPALRSLSVAMCPSLTDRTLYHLSRSSQCLDDLDISHNPNYSDQGLRFIASKLRGLSSLNISNCDGFTDMAVGHLQSYCRRLKNLDMSFNSAITEQAVEQLELRLSHLLLHKRLINCAA